MPITPANPLARPIRLGVFSDSHGARGQMLAAARAFTGCDYILFLGDGECDLDDFAAPANATLLTVRGNCDWFSDSPDKRILRIGDTTMLMTHGHVYNVKQSLTTLSFAAREAGVQLVLYGHTHTPAVTSVSSTTYLNPGTLKSGQYAIVELTAQGIQHKLMHLSESS